MKNELKLHLGCFNKKIHGFINIDIREDVNPDVVDNIFTLEKFEPNSIDLIYACHVLEHLDRKESKLALKRWYEILKPGGVARIAVPDVEKAFKHYLYYGDFKFLYSFLWGSQRHPFDYHKHGWTLKTIKEDLCEVGFTDVKEYDWKQTEHFYIDDYSQAYYPHMDKLNGELLSLNIEARK